VSPTNWGRSPTESASLNIEDRFDQRYHTSVVWLHVAGGPAADDRRALAVEFSKPLGDQGACSLGLAQTFRSALVLRSISDGVRRTAASASANLRRKPLLIARRAVHHCAPLQVGPAKAPATEAH
jgi:hypothetical protein